MSNNNNSAEFIAQLAYDMNDELTMLKEQKADVEADIAKVKKVIDDYQNKATMRTSRTSNSMASLQFITAQTSNLSSYRNTVLKITEDIINTKSKINDQIIKLRSNADKDDDNNANQAILKSLLHTIQNSNPEVINNKPSLDDNKFTILNEDQADKKLNSII